VKAVIVGCGRVGAELAELFESGGYDVIILDTSTRAFDRLPDTFRGAAVRGDGTDEDTLRRSGAEDADVFIAMTEGDNRNVMAAQLASEVLGARRVIAKINDPLRAKAYASLGIGTLCRTMLMRDAVAGYVGMAISGDPGIYPPTGQHHGGEHHEPVSESDEESSPIDLGAEPGEMAIVGGGPESTEGDVEKDTGQETAPTGARAAEEA
jgi:trk/ktr system potassium uptake protein